MRWPCLRFHVVGAWTRLRVQWVTSTQHVPEEVGPLIEQAWRDACARPGVKLFDGPMCRLESWQAEDDGGLALRLSRTSYKLFLGTNLAHPGFADRFGPSALANPVGVSPLLLTSDGFAMLGRRNATVAYYPNRVHPFAGALEPRDPLDPFAEVRRELREELDFDDADVARMVCTGIAEDLSIRQPELIFVVHSSRSRDAVRRMVLRDEHHGAYECPVSSAAFERVLSEQRAADAEFTPVAIAALLLFGRLEWGRAWFERVSARFVRGD